DGGTLTLEASQRVSEVLDHVVELPAQGGASSNQHVVVTRSQIVGRGTWHDVAEAPAHAIAFDRGSNLARHRESDPCRPSIVAIASLQHECRRRNLGPAGCGQEIRPLLPPEHRDARGCGSGAEPLAATVAPGGNHLAASRGRHAGAKSMTALAHDLAGLIGPLHGCFSAWCSVWPVDRHPSLFAGAMPKGGFAPE